MINVNRDIVTRKTLDAAVREIRRYAVLPLDDNTLFFTTVHEQTAHHFGECAWLFEKKARIRD